jgi:hypothetical protein
VLLVESAVVCLVGAGLLESFVKSGLAPNDMTFGAIADFLLECPMADTARSIGTGACAFSLLTLSAYACEITDALSVVVDNRVCAVTGGTGVAYEEAGEALAAEIAMPADLVRARGCCLTACSPPSGGCWTRDSDREREQIYHDIGELLTGLLMSGSHRFAAAFRAILDAFDAYDEFLGVDTLFLESIVALIRSNSVRFRQLKTSSPLIEFCFGLVAWPSEDDMLSIGVHESSSQSSPMRAATKFGPCATRISPV